MITYSGVFPPPIHHIRGRNSDKDRCPVTVRYLLVKPLLGDMRIFRSDFYRSYRKTGAVTTSATPCCMSGRT